MGVKQQGMSKEQTAAMVKDELADEGSEPIDLPPSKPADPAPPAVTSPPPAASATVDVQSLVQMLATAMQQNGASTAQAIKEGLSEASKDARAPILETYSTGGYPEISVYSHPDGDLVHPRTVLRCPMYLGVYDEDGQVKPAFEVFEETSTEQERVVLNALKPGEYRIERNDGRAGLCRVVERKDDLGQTNRLVIAFPETWLSKDQQAALPALVNKYGSGLLQQLTPSAA